MRRYLWILLFAFMSTTVYAAKTSEEMKMDVYGVSTTDSMKGEGLEEGDLAIMLSGKVGAKGELQTLHVGSYLNQGMGQIPNESIVLQEGEDTLEKISSILTNYEGTLYLSLYGETAEARMQIQHIYEGILQDEKVATNTNLDLRLAYTPLDEKDLGFKQLPYIEAINMNMNALKDGKKLSYIQELGPYEILISDYLARGYGSNIAEGLDAISIFYYDFILDKPANTTIKPTNIFVCSNLVQAPPKYANFYKGLEKELQPMTRLEISKSKEVALTITGSQLQLLTRPTDKQGQIEYVEYKVNEAHGGQSFRYPYVLNLDKSLFHEGINEIKVIMKLKGRDEYGVTSFYVDNEAKLTYGKRATRQEGTYSLGQKPTYKKPYIPVLMYHKFKDQVAPTQEDQSMSVSTQLFERQLKALLEAGYTPVNFRELQAYLEGKGGLPSKPFILTADDGYLCNYEKAYPILKKYKVPATFFITSLYMGVENSHDHFTWEQAKEMEASGLVDIQSHTHGHTLMNGLNEETVHYEIEKSFADIQKYLGTRDVKVLAYPQFLHTRAVKEWVKDCGVDLQVTNLASAKRGSSNKTTKIDIKRIHVSNDLSPERLISIIKGLTQ